MREPDAGDLCSSDGEGSGCEKAPSEREPGERGGGARGAGRGARGEDGRADEDGEEIRSEKSGMEKFVTHARALATARRAQLPPTHGHTGKHTHS